MKKIADAADPLYKTLDDGQKRRLAMLTHMEHRFGGGGWRPADSSAAWMDGDGDRGYDREATGRGSRPGGAERL